jgi:hypothetical protein
MKAIVKILCHTFFSICAYTFANSSLRDWYAHQLLRPQNDLHELQRGGQIQLQLTGNMLPTNLNELLFPEDTRRKSTVTEYLHCDFQPKKDTPTLK